MCFGRRKWKEIKGNWRQCCVVKLTSGSCGAFYGNNPHSPSRSKDTCNPLHQTRHPCPSLKKLSSEAPRRCTTSQLYTLLIRSQRPLTAQHGTWDAPSLSVYVRARAGKCQSGEGSAWWGPGPSLRGYASKRGHWERGERKFFVHVQTTTIMS